MPHNDFGYDKRSWLSITGIVSHDKTGTPQDTLEQFAPLYEGTPKSTEEAWQRIAIEWISEVDEVLQIALVPTTGAASSGQAG